MIKTVKNDNNSYDIFTPYNPGFISEIKRIGGARWNPSAKAWNIPAGGIADARAMMQKYYGETDIPTDQKAVTIRVRFKDDTYTRRGGVMGFGKTLARAWGRDSGARVGEGVVLESGEITSGGSLSKWETIVKAGATFRLTVPESIYESEKDSWDWSVEIVDDAKEDKRTALVAEKEKILTRLTEIEKELSDLG